MRPLLRGRGPRSGEGVIIKKFFFKTQPPPVHFAHHLPKGRLCVAGILASLGGGEPLAVVGVFSKKNFFKTQTLRLISFGTSPYKGGKGVIVFYYAYLIAKELRQNFFKLIKFKFAPSFPFMKENCARGRSGYAVFSVPGFLRAVDLAAHNRD